MFIKKLTIFLALHNFLISDYLKVKENKGYILFTYNTYNNFLLKIINFVFFDNFNSWNKQYVANKLHAKFKRILFILIIKFMYKKHISKIKIFIINKFGIHLDVKNLCKK